MINPKYLLKTFYLSIETEYTEVMSYNNHDQSQVFAQNVLFKHRNWIYWGRVWIYGGHVLYVLLSMINPKYFPKCSIQASKLNMLRSCLITTMISPKYLLKMLYSSIETEYTEIMSYNSHDQSQVLGQNVLSKHQNVIYWGHVWWQPWSIPSTCSKSSIQASKLNILRSCLMTTIINAQYLLKTFCSSIETEYTEVMSECTEVMSYMSYCPWSIPSTWSKCSIQVSKLSIVRSCLMTTIISPKYLLKMFYSSIKTEYAEVMSYENHDQSQVFAQNLVFKHRNWIYWGHVL